jgi:predicted Rossmann fold flavoprotein
VPNAPFDALVIGGGAAGVFAAIGLKQHLPQQRIALLEAGSQPLAKVKISGGGRCNVTHHTADLPYLLAHYPRGQKELASVFRRWMPQDTMAWFAQRGVALKTEADGRVFPVSDCSQTIINCLLGELRALSVPLLTRQTVVSLAPGPDGSWQVQAAGLSQPYTARAVLVASGGNPRLWQLLARLGQPTVDAVPSLFTFCVKAHPLLSGRAGLSFPNVLGYVDDQKKRTQQGPLLITHWGLSGPVVLKLSAWEARSLHAHGYQTRLTVDFCPDTSWEDLGRVWADMKAQHPKKQLASVCPIPGLPRRYWEGLVTMLDAQGTLWAQASKQQLETLTQHLKRQCFDVSGKGVFKEEFVTAGGVARPGVDFKTMHSRLLPGLFFAGEVLDVDGLTGGFNFQNAWATGKVAADGMSDYLAK